MRFDIASNLQCATLLTFLSCTILSTAQFPPTPNYTTVLQSPLDSSITISYKSPDEGTCTTAFSTQKQYSGYINLPPFTLAPIQQNYSINTFFWFIEARENPDTAPLTIYINGGPGASSMFGLFEEAGPCQVVELPDGSYGTAARMFGWDRSSNIIFIDQPDQVGFSYDTPTNGSYDFLSEYITYPPSSVPSRHPDYTHLSGTFSSGQQYATPNTTQIAAHAVWHFLQSWLAAFPQYNPGIQTNNTGSPAAGINLFAESYGGQYGPVFANLFEEQNALRLNGSIDSNKTLPIYLSSLGIINGLVDSLIQSYYYPFFAYNNTYGIQAISQIDQLNTLNLFEDSCTSAINACRTAASIMDAEENGDVADVNSRCKQADYVCNNVTTPYYAAGYNAYDIRVSNPSPNPPAAYQEYLNTASVQASIGVPINYTEQSPLVQKAFISTGDEMRGISIYDLANLLRLGVRVGFMYGDADYICNWQGGEAVSLALAGLLPDYPNPQSLPTSTTSSSPSAATPPIGSTPGVPGSYAAAFPKAGYADIVVNSTYVGGAVRQYGNLSFSRVYSAGHFIPYFQPETAFTIFSRIILGTDLSTGTAINLSNFSSTGPANSTFTQSAPSTQPSPTCWIRDIHGTCTSEDIQGITNGEGVVEAGVWYSNSKDVTRPSSTVTAGVPGTPASRASSTPHGKSSSTSVAVTGVYTATGTPSPTGAAVASKGLSSSVWVLGWSALLGGSVVLYIL